MRLDIKKAKESLDRLVTNVIGKPISFLLAESEADDRQPYRIQACSDSITHELGLPLFKHISISTFGSATYNESDQDFRFRMHYQYVHLEGGSNGCGCVTAYLSPAGAIKKIELPGQRESIEKDHPQFYRLVGLTQKESQESFDLKCEKAELIASKLRQKIDLDGLRDIYIDGELLVSPVSINVVTARKSDWAPDTESHKSIEVIQAITVDLDANTIYTSSALSCDKFGFDFECPVSSELIDEENKISTNNMKNIKGIVDKYSDSLVDINYEKCDLIRNGSAFDESTDSPAM